MLGGGGGGDCQGVRENTEGKVERRGKGKG